MSAVEKENSEVI